MALRLWVSSTANSLKISTASSKSHLYPPFSLSRCFSTVLDGLKYASSHEWVKHEGAVATIGITDHAQHQPHFELRFDFAEGRMCTFDLCKVFKDHLGEVVFVELPESGGAVAQGKSFGNVESVKATSDINSPISGEIVEVNSKLTESPGLINTSPYEEGWMIKIKPSNPSELETLLGATEYTKFCEEEEGAH